MTDIFSVKVSKYVTKGITPQDRSNNPPSKEKRSKKMSRSVYYKHQVGNEESKLLTTLRNLL